MSDDRDFLKGLDMADAAVRNLVAKGMARASLQLLDDAVNQSPLIPLDEGTLQGSGSAFVNEELVAIADPVGGNPTPATAFKPESEKDAVVCTVGFNTPYAAYQHEGIRKDETHEVQEYSLPDGRGPKFLERAMIENSDDYVGVVADTVRDGLGGAA